VAQPFGTDQAAVTLANTEGEIGALTISNPSSGPELLALLCKAEELVDDVRNLSTLIHSLRTVLVGEELVKGSAKRSCTPTWRTPPARSRRWPA
jgi:hypothetical protein